MVLGLHMMRTSVDLGNPPIFSGKTPVEELRIKAMSESKGQATIDSSCKSFAHTSGPLFQSMRGETVTHRISQRLCKLVSFMVLNPKLYKGHTFQIGAAAHAASLGLRKLHLEVGQMAFKCSSLIHSHIFIWYIIFNIYYNPTRVQHLAAQIVENTDPSNAHPILECSMWLLIKLATLKRVKRLAAHSSNLSFACNNFTA